MPLGLKNEKAPRGRELTEKNTNAVFGQELLTQELVTFEQVHVNVSQTLIITTEDRMNLWLIGVICRIKKQTEWIAPLGLVIAITLTLTTTSFNDFVLPAATWHAIFLIVDLLSALWLALSLRHLRQPIDVTNEIAQLKNFSSLSSDGEGGREND